MQYMKVEWRHSFETEPVLLYSEIDEGRRERRKIELFRDGRIGIADVDKETGTTRLGVDPIPVPEEIAANSEFILHEISADEFDLVWQNALKSQK